MELSPDLGLTKVNAAISFGYLEIPNFPQASETGASEIPLNSPAPYEVQRVSWPDMELIANAKNGCFLVADDSICKIQVFSEETNRLYTLYPTSGAPTMLVSGVPMHRIKGTDPWQDTLTKIKTLAPVVGRVLDTATGLGYTAIAAAETADEVLTLELDPAALEIARMNPWSQALFDNPKIRRLVRDSLEAVPTLEDSSFSRIVHDPPMFNLAGDLYSEEFYRQLFRVLKRGGRLFHYVGDLESRSGRNVAKGVIRRLQQAGFTHVERRPEAFGVTAAK